MSLDLAAVATHWGYVLLLLVVPLAFKLGLVVLAARAFGAPLASSLRTGFYLAQASELALVMLALARTSGLVDPALAQVVLAAMVLSMLAAPVVIQFAEPIVRRLTANDWLARAAQLTTIASTAMSRQEHVLICGYGRSGQNLARLLERESIPFVALDNDPERVREAAGAGASVVYGDAGRREALVAAGLPKAKALAITFADTHAAMKILHHAQALRPELPVIVRTVDDSDLDRLMKAGATEVVPEVLEGSLMLASHSLLVLGVPLNRVLARIRADPRGALQPVPRVLPRRHRRRGRGGQRAAPPAFGAPAGGRGGGGALAGRARRRGRGGDHRRAPPGARPGPAAGRFPPGGRRRRGPARPADRPRAGGGAAAGGVGRYGRPGPATCPAARPAATNATPALQAGKAR